MKIIGITCLGNEEGRFLEEVLEEKSELCDTIIALGDKPTDKTASIASSFEKVKYYQTREKLFNTQQWKLKEWALQLAIKEEPDWILAFDADELLDKRITRSKLEWLAQQGKSFEFEFVHLWGDRNHIRIDSGWRKLTKVIYYKYEKEEEQRFVRKSLHCGLAPTYAHRNTLLSGFIVKHLGYMAPKHRPAKIRRYEHFDPEGKIKPKSWYQSIKQNGDVVEFNEDDFIKTIPSDIL